jgi:hypothetical protein
MANVQYSATNTQRIRSSQEPRDKDMSQPHTNESCYRFLPAMPTLRGVPAGRDTAMLSDGMRAERFAGARSTGARTRPRAAERAPVTVAGLAERRAAGETGEKASAEAAMSASAKIGFLHAIATDAMTRGRRRSESGEELEFDKMGKFYGSGSASGLDDIRVKMAAFISLIKALREHVRTIHDTHIGKLL